jgi:DNA primase
VGSLAASVDLFSLVGINTKLRKTAGTRGGEYHGACPLCGGSDRFWIHPRHDPPEWKCRGCGRGGDAIDYVRERDGVGFLEACAFLGIDPGQARPDRSEAAPIVEDVEPPRPEWQVKARAFVDYAVACLWSKKGERALAYLHEHRKLSDDTIRSARLGFNPVKWSQRPTAWGHHHPRAGG